MFARVHVRQISRPVRYTDETTVDADPKSVAGAGEGGR